MRFLPFLLLGACIASTPPRDPGDPTPGDPGLQPPKPDALVAYVTGNPLDAEVTPTGPGLVLMGGGTEVDAAFEWGADFLSGGDVVVLRTSGSSGYNDYLYTDIGGIDSVETLLVTSRELANDPYVRWTVAHAEGIFLAGGDQSTYLANWKSTGVEYALEYAWSRGAILGGTSAGLAVLGEFAFSADNGTVYSDEALADPYNEYVLLARDFLALPPLAGVITDSHFGARDRMGRLITFLARIVRDGWDANPIGLGIDERTALVVASDGTGTVMGEGSVYLVKSNGTPATCAAGTPLDYAGLPLFVLSDGDTVSLPAGTTSVAGTTVSASGGVTVPADPY
jgi:cyanophycinase